MFLPESINYYHLAEAKWLGTGTLAHHRLQEATHRNEADEMTMSDGIEIGGMMLGDHVGGVVQEARRWVAPKSTIIRETVLSTMNSDATAIEIYPDEENDR